MLTGIDLGKAIDSARKLKGVSKAEMARHFHVQPPSVSGWISTGRIDKKKLSELFEYFRDVAGPEHWGLGSNQDMLYRQSRTESPGGEFEVRDQDGDASAIFDAATPRTRQVLLEMMSSAARGELTEADALLLHQMYKRIVKK